MRKGTQTAPVGPYRRTVSHSPGLAQHERRKVIWRNDGDLGGWLHVKGRVYVSARERTMSNEGGPPCRRNTGGPRNYVGSSLRPGVYRPGDGSPRRVRTLVCKNPFRLLGRVVNSYSEWQLNFARAARVRRGRAREAPIPQGSSCRRRFAKLSRTGRDVCGSWN